MDKNNCPETFEDFIGLCCLNCTANDYYCPTICSMLEKAKEIPFDKIQSKYIQHDGDIVKILKWIKNKKI